MGKITRNNIIKICSSYRPCPVRRNIENPLQARCTNRSVTAWLTHGTSPLFPWASGRPSCPVSGPTLSRTHSSPQQGAPSVVDIRCLTVVSRGIREPSEEEGGTQQPLPAVPGNPVYMYHKPAREPFCGLICTSGFLLWASRDIGARLIDHSVRIVFYGSLNSH